MFKIHCKLFSVTFRLSLRLSSITIMLLVDMENTMLPNARQNASKRVRLVEGAFAGGVAPDSAASAGGALYISGFPGVFVPTAPLRRPIASVC